MKARRITNISERDAVIKLSNGNTLQLSPKDSVENINALNLEQVKDQVKVTYDLSEFEQPWVIDG